MITQEKKDVLNQYAEIKKEIKRLETIADELNPRVLEVMQEQEVEEIGINDIGKLSLGSRRKWKYPEAINMIETDLKSKKKEAEQTGAASYTENMYVIFKGLKEYEDSI